MSAADRINYERLATITTLYPGGGSDTDHMCVMQAVDSVTSGGLSENPACACPVVTGYSIVVNDRMPDRWRQRLIPYIPLIAWSRASAEVEQQRAYLAATWAVKVFAPLALDAGGFDEYAATLRALPDITDRASARRARDAASNAAAYAGVWIDAHAAANAAMHAAASTTVAHANAAAYAGAYAAVVATVADADLVWGEALACLDALLLIGRGATPRNETA